MRIPLHLPLFKGITYAEHTITQAQEPSLLPTLTSRRVRKICALILLQCAIAFMANAQSAIKQNEVLPPPPNASELGKFGNVNVGLTSGTSNVSVPVYNLTSRTITVPVTLNYSSGGVKVDQIASRVGMNWVLQAGGVITRTIYGDADEDVTKIKPPADYSGNRTTEYLDYLRSITNYEDVDSQHDLFNYSFNGAAGKFVLDSALQPMFLEKTNIRLQKNFSPTAPWTFKITDGKGIEYYFGGVGATEKTKKVQSVCGKSYDQYKPTAWYLKTIIDPGVDTVQFIYSSLYYIYKTGISQSASRSPVTSQTPKCPCDMGECSSINSTQTCVQELSTEGVILTGIQTSTYTKIGFTHTERLDVVHDSLVNKMTIYRLTDNNWAPFKEVNFGYQVVTAPNQFVNTYNNTDIYLRYRPFLTSLTIASADNTIAQNYQFEYDDPAGLPRRLSFCQDIWGFFNGQQNSTLLYPTDNAAINAQFSDITLANRAFVAGYAKKGLLTKITYPTGGYDSLYYESNSTYGMVLGNPPKNTIGVTATSTQWRQEIIQRDTFQINYVPGGTTVSAILLKYGTVSDPGSTSPHQQVIVKLYDKGTGTIIYNHTFREHFYINDTFDLQYQHEYVLEIRAEAEFTETTGSAYIEYQTGPAPVSYQNTEVPGVRIAKTVTGDPVTASRLIKKYYYATLNDLTKSSGYYTCQTPVNYNAYEQFLECPLVTPSAANGYCSQPYIGLTLACGSYYTIMSSSLNNIYIYPNGLITYQTVVEGNGENFENGGVEHTFEVSYDVPSHPILNDGVISAPYSNTSYRSGLELYRNTFKKTAAGTLLPVEKVYNTYTSDSRGNFVIENFTIEKKYNRTVFHDPPNDEDFATFSAALYYWIGNWTYLDSSHVVTYMDNGDTLVRSHKSYYENATHLQPTKDVTKNSQAQELINIYKYPNDKQNITGLTTSASQAIDTLIGRNALNTAIETENYVGGVLQQRVRNNYNNWSVGGKIFPLPQNIEQQIKNNPLERKIEFFSYDQFGRLKEQSKALDAKKAYIWDYKNSFPVAEAINASPDRIAYTSFEADGLGNWSLYPGSTIFFSSNAFTGKNVISGGVQKTVPTGNYIIGVWSYANTWVNGQLLTQNPTRIIGPWRYFEVVLNNVSEIWVRGDTIDEVRLIPAGAQMTTYTYDPLVGVTSQSDANSHITYYEYDSFGRLKHVRDENKNVLKTYDYQYQKNYNQ